jgi:hypothetical protein
MQQTHSASKHKPENCQIFVHLECQLIFEDLLYFLPINERISKKTQKNHNKNADPHTIRLMCSSAIILIQSTFATLACKQIRKQHHRSYCQFDIQWPRRKISTSLLMRDSLMEVDCKLRMTGIYQKLSLSQDKH